LQQQLNHQMALLNLFSKRQRRLRGEVPDVYQYTDIPKPLRVQIAHILQDALGDDSFARDSQSERAYLHLHNMLAREFGVFRLGQHSDAKANVLELILNEPDVERVLDCVELGFQFVETYGNDRSYTAFTTPRQTPTEAIEELNSRFKEHGVGFQFASSNIIRIDSEYLHTEAIKPTLGVLHDKAFAGAEKEFLSAHEHYRNGRNEEAISDCLKALESTMKTICTKRKWVHNETDTAKTLLDVCYREGLIPPYLQSEFSALRSVLESGVPTVRNKQGGHGSGPVPRSVPGHLASYVLQLTAASILFLANAEQTLP
jgi:hypothetical protein